MNICSEATNIIDDEDRSSGYALIARGNVRGRFTGTHSINEIEFSVLFSPIISTNTHENTLQ